MGSFHQGLISNVTQLLKSQYTLAKEHGHEPTDVVLGGGPVRNKWFWKSMEQVVKSNYPELNVHAVTK